MSDGQLDISSIPQMVTLTFNGAVNIDNILLYDKLFNEERLNPNGCTARGTFFVSHKYTNYSAVQELHRCRMVFLDCHNRATRIFLFRKGHEIGVFSITNSEDHEYWSKGSYDDWLGEMAGARLIIERFANISGDGLGSVVGVRAPYLKVNIGSNAISGCPHTHFYSGWRQRTV